MIGKCCFFMKIIKYKVHNFLKYLWNRLSNKIHLYPIINSLYTNCYHNISMGSEKVKKGMCVTDWQMENYSIVTKAIRLHKIYFVVSTFRNMIAFYWHKEQVDQKLTSDYSENIQIRHSKFMIDNFLVSLRSLNLGHSPINSLLWIYANTSIKFLNSMTFKFSY